MTHIYANCQAYLFQLLIFLSVFISLMFGNPVADGKKMYWTDMRGIHHADLNGKNVETLLPLLLSAPRGIAVDSVGGKIYWVDRHTQKIQRANLDGTNVEDVFNQTVGQLHDIVIDARERKVYWTDGLFGFPQSRIRRANLDFDDVEEIVTELETPESIAIDSIRRKIYWTDTHKDKKHIWYANLDGTNVDSFTWDGVADGMAFNEIDRKLYWSDVNGFRIWQANPDGTNIELAIRTDRARVWGITVAVEERKIYWVDFGGVHRANLDGTSVENLVTIPLKDPWGIAVDEKGGKIYWVDAGNYRIQRANPDGSNIEDIVSTDFTFVYGVAIDGNKEKIYWTDGIWLKPGKRIRRSNLDGTAIEELITVNSKSPISIAVDSVEEKLYWGSSSKIQSSKLDDFQPQDLVDISEDAFIGDIAIDSLDKRIYWTDTNLGKILRSNLDGTNTEKLVKKGVKRPFGIAVDSCREKTYWTDMGKLPDLVSKIQRANLDGTDIEELFAIEQNVLRGIAIDVDEGKIYWLNHAAGKIQRSNLDGTNIEELVTGLVEPQFITLDLPSVSDCLDVVYPKGKQIIPWGSLRQNVLFQNFPNPFSIETWIPFFLTQSADVAIQIYDIHGQIVRTLKLGRLKARFYNDSTEAAYWDGRNNFGEKVSSGVYFYTLQAGDYSATKRMLIVK